MLWNIDGGVSTRITVDRLVLWVLRQTETSSLLAPNVSVASKEAIGIDVHFDLTTPASTDHL